VSARVRWDGLDELKAWMRNLPASATGEATRIVEGAANAAAADARAGYVEHRFSGDLESHVVVTHFERGKFTTGAIVKNTAHHAWLFENGTMARHYVTEKGKTHLTGAARAMNVFRPAMIRRRKIMYEQLKTMLLRIGFTQVTGDA
jgi:hypothetical protein